MDQLQAALRSGTSGGSDRSCVCAAWTMGNTAFVMSDGSQARDSACIITGPTVARELARQAKLGLISLENLVELRITADTEPGHLTIEHDGEGNFTMSGCFGGSIVRLGFGIAAMQQLVDRLRSGELDEPVDDDTATDDIISAIN